MIIDSSGGDYYDSQLNAKVHIPQRVGDASNFTDVASYNHHVVAVQGEGKQRRFFAWGDNSKKQISLSDDAYFATPQEIFLPANENF
jgi:alpha-tubulin suppressor-like RCC1 family protein